MEPLTFYPEDDSSPHQILAELALEEGNGLTFRIRDDGEDIGQIDVEAISVTEGFVTGIGPGEKINNGYLRTASMAILACMREDCAGYEQFQLYDIENQLLG